MFFFQIGADIGFIPSPAKLETLRIQLAQNRNVKLHSGGNKPSSAANLSKFLHSQKSKDATSSSSASAGGGGKNNNTGERSIWFLAENRDRF